MDEQLAQQYLLELLTNRARRVITLAREAADRAGGGRLTPEQLLQGLIAEGAGVAALALTNLGLPMRKLHRQLAERARAAAENAPTTVELDSDAAAAPGGAHPRRLLRPETRAVLEAAGEEAREAGQRRIGTEHLLLGVLRAGGPPADFLRQLGVTPERLRAEVRLLTSSAAADSGLLPAQAGSPVAAPAGHRAAGQNPEASAVFRKPELGAPGAPKAPAPTTVRPGAAGLGAADVARETQRLYEILAARLGPPRQGDPEGRTPGSSEIRRLERAIEVLEEQRTVIRRDQRDETLIAVDQGLLELRKKLGEYRRRKQRRKMEGGA